MTDAPDPACEVLETRTDPDFPTITLELARCAFDLIDRDAPHGFERDDYDRVRQGFARATPDQADRAWHAAVRLLDYLPLEDLGAALARLPDLDEPLYRAADYALTWGLWHHRAGFGYREGVDDVPGEVGDDWRPAIDGSDELEAVNAIAVELGLEPSPMADPDNWRRYRLHGGVFWKIAAQGPAERETLKQQLAGRGLGPAGLTTATDFIDRVVVPERHRHV